jgi:hypothetical protein
MKIKNGRLPLTLIYQMQTYKTTTSAYYRLPASNSAWYRLIASSMYFAWQIAVLGMMGRLM